MANAKNSEPVLILGEGSNVLFLDDFAGTVIVNRIMGIDVEESADSWHLHVGAGENWHHLVQYTLEKGMPGLENLALFRAAGSSPIQTSVPMALNKHVCEYVDCIELATGTALRLTAEQCRFGYATVFSNMNIRIAM
jgi:UDP-N-acetylmuramate dehydrogenase